MSRKLIYAGLIVLTIATVLAYGAAFGLWALP